MSISGFSQDSVKDSIPYRCFVGTTAFLLGNLAETNNPEFFQLNFGYRLTNKDVLSLEVKTWKYQYPLGLNALVNEAYGSDSERFPGFIREYGFAFVYQRFWWKGLYSSIHIMNAWQRFVDVNGDKLDNGFQIFNTYRIGYQIRLVKNRFFIEPSIAVTHRPFHTEMPLSFKTVDDRWPKYLIGEPGFHIGLNF